MGLGFSGMRSLRAKVSGFPISGLGSAPLHIETTPAAYDVVVVAPHLDAVLHEALEDVLTSIGGRLCDPKP